MALDTPFRFLNDLDDVLTSYNEGQKENSQNNNLILPGMPRTGKGQVSGWAKEHGMAGDHVKLFEVHCSKISHLAEVFQFLFPNGFFLNRKSREIVESVHSELKRESYSDPVLSLKEVKELLDLHENGSPPERIEKFDEFLEKEENYSLRQRLKEARGKQVEIRDRLQQTHKWCYTNPDVPDAFRGNYTDSLNDKFSIKVFTPITKNMPTGEVPDFFEPFGVPVDDFERFEQLKWSLRIIHPDRFDQYKDFYGRVVEVGDTSFEDLKNVDELQESDHFVTKEYGDGEEFQVTRVRNEKNIKEKFQRDWDGTFTEGVVCSSSFDYNLRPRLKEAMLSDEPDVVTLYTGFISDETLRKFVMVYFMETMFDIVRNLSGDELKKLDKQFIASLIEAQEVVKKSTKSNSLSNADRVFNRFIWEAMNDSGHYNFNFWFDTKPSETHSNLLSKTSKRIITRMNKENVRSWYSGNTRDEILKGFTSPGYRKLDGSYPEFGYGFIYDDEVVEWTDSYGVKKYGHRLPCPRMCVQDPVDQISNSDWRFFTEELGFDSMRFQEYQDALFKEDWEANAEPYVEERKRQAEEEAEEEENAEQTRKEMLQNLACEKLRSRVNELGEVPSTWTSHAKQILEELHDEGMAEEWDHHRNVMDATLDLRKDLEENFESGDGVAGIDVYQVKDEIKEIERNGVPVFINENLASRDKKQRVVKRYILRNYDDIGEDAAEELAEEATGEAILDLQMDEVINSNFRPMGEYAEDPKKYWDYLGVDPDDDVDEDSGGGVDKESEASADESEDDEEARDDVEYVSVKIDSSVPEIRGTDLEVYGPFEDGEVVEIPADNAEILVNRDNAEFVDTGSEKEVEEGPEAPGEEWVCTCGKLNGTECGVCQNPKCLKPYEEVEEKSD